jgi:hypothetical protein
MRNGPVAALSPRRCLSSCERASRVNFRGARAAVVRVADWESALPDGVTACVQVPIGPARRRPASDRARREARHLDHACR